jgi:hypothetical protein
LWNVRLRSPDPDAAERERFTAFAGSGEMVDFRKRLAGKAGIKPVDTCVSSSP